MPDKKYLLLVLIVILVAFCIYYFLQHPKTEQLSGVEIHQLSPIKDTTPRYLEITLMPNLEISNVKTTSYSHNPDRRTFGNNQLVVLNSSLQKVFELSFNEHEISDCPDCGPQPLLLYVPVSIEPRIVQVRKSGELVTQKELNEYFDTGIVDLGINVVDPIELQDPNIAEIPKDKVHILFTSSGYSFEDKDDFVNYVDKYINEGILAYEPFSSRQDELFFSYIFTTGDFDCFPNTAGEEDLIICDYSKLFEQLGPIDYDAIVLSVKVPDETNRRATSSFAYRVAVTRSANSRNAVTTTVHELGHALAHLKDEYVYDSTKTAPESYLTNYNCLEGKPFDDAWVGIKSSDLHQGCTYINWYRTSATSMMRSSSAKGATFNEISQHIINQALDMYLEKKALFVNYNSYQGEKRIMVSGCNQGVSGNARFKLYAFNRNRLIDVGDYDLINGSEYGEGCFDYQSISLVELPSPVKEQITNGESYSFKGSLYADSSNTQLLHYGYIPQYLTYSALYDLSGNDVSDTQDIILLIKSLLEGSDMYDQSDLDYNLDGTLNTQDLVKSIKHMLGEQI